MSKKFIFSSESVGEGHPDKVADYISDSILDACLEQDPNSRVACETLVKSNCVFLAGEISTNAKLNYEEIVRQAIREIGYTNDDDIFHADQVFVSNILTAQSSDIAQGVDAAEAAGKKTAEQGAGDQGIMFGYACNQTPELMPAAIMYAHRLLREMARQRKELKVDWLRPDVKSQVALEYVDGQPVAIRNVVISTQHAEGKAHAEIEAFCIEVIRKVLPAEMLTDQTEYLINPTGNFVIGGPQGDAGLTGRKIIVDTYGGWARHGGGAFSGKDPSKVDRSAAYFTRWVAKNIVAAGLADECELQVAYAIGHPYPTSVHVDTFGTGTVSDAEIAAAAQKVFSFKPADIVSQLDLLRPIYRESTHYGHFAKDNLPWESTHKSEELKAAL
ncbi:MULTISPECIES: methionine adenosyltransferase [unclassified Lentimonas]|uniref:methionine adenosyltransferase n=1 Tax=unclassified Lentimonas TaxID=2630993 RepID=UPI00132C02F8|nr:MULTISPECIES: methionine adenosyltransferase [unclassified Lentimonas]CAA6691816.1 S-adenosylmethionine synthetase (EC [Lentimonas sp. CC19]CAA6694563.1 S-adenosylmethionine synthetase (EC [Lentimonas sp. CC10]CAA7072104.1 S-adenosylmethionine synthetase (EC [Lentimonas sp. CC11]